jgi:hypothetical protein
LAVSRFRCLAAGRHFFGRWRELPCSGSDYDQTERAIKAPGGKIDRSVSFGLGSAGSSAGGGKGGRWT